MKTRHTTLAKTRPLSICTSTIAIAGMVLAQVNPLFVATADAQTTVTWLGTGTGGAIWSDGTNWVGGVAPLATDALIFTGTNGTVTTNDLTPLIAIGSGSGTAITFANGNQTASAFTLSGNAITLSGNIVATGTTSVTTQRIDLNMTLDGDRSVTNTTQNTVRVNGVISEDATSRGLIKSGAGVLLLNGANTFSGQVQIDQGTVTVGTLGGLANIGSASALGTGTGVSAIRMGNGANAGALLLATGTVASTTDRQIVIGNGGTGGATIQNDSAAAGVVTFTNASFNAAAVGAGVRTLTLQGSNTGLNTISGVISDNTDRVNLTKAGAGSWTLTGANTFTGQVLVTQGTLTVSNVANGGLASSLGAATGTASVLVLGNAGNTGTLTYTGAAVGSTDRQVQIGSGATNTNGGATLTANGSGGAITFSNAAFNALSTGTVARTLTLQGTSTLDNTISGVIADNTVTGRVNLTKAAAGKWVLGGVNTYTGTTNIDQGTLSINSLTNAGVAGSLGAATGTASNINIASAGNAGVLLYTGAGDSTDRQVVIGRTSGTGSATIQNDGGGALLFTNGAFNAPSTGTAARAFILAGSNGGANEIQGVIANNAVVGGAVSLFKNGSGTWNLSAANTYSGNTTVTDGTLTASITGALGTGTAVTVSGGTLNLNATNASVGAVANVSGGTLNVNATNFSASAVANVSGGTLNLNATGAFAGTLANLTGGTMFLGVAGALNPAATVQSAGGFIGAASLAAGSISNVVNITANGGGVSGTNTIELTGPVTNSGGNRTFNNNISGIGQQLLISGPLNLSEGTANRAFTLGGSGNTTITGLITGGTGGANVFNKEGAGTVTVSNTGNAYTGGTNISGGTFKLGASEVIPNASIVTIRQQGPGSTSGILDLNGNSETIGGFTLGSTAAGTAGGIGGQTPLVTNTGAPATLTVLGNITYNAGAAGVENGPALIDSSLTYSLGAATRTFTVGDSSAAAIDLTIAAQIVRTGTAAVGIIKAGAGVLELTNAANAFDGAITVNGGELRPTVAGALGVGTGAITVSATGTGATALLNLNGFNQTAATLTMGGGLTSTASLQTGAGTLTVAGAVTYSATGNPNGSLLSGNLSLGAATRTFAIGDSSAAANDLTVSALITTTGTAGGITKTGAGTLVLSNPGNTYNGPTTINGGTIEVTKLSDGGTASGIGQAAATANQLVISGGTLAYSGGGDSTNRLFTIGTGSAGATIDSSGTGPLNFTGTGPIAIAAGTAARALVLTGANTGGANTFSPVIPSNGTGGAISLVKNGTNTWNLTSLNTYTGTTTVNAGVLSVGPGASVGTGPVTVNGGSLNGTGNLGAITTATGGVVSPGNSIGAATATSLNMSAGGTFKLEIDSTIAAIPGIDTLTLSAGLVLDGVGTLSILDVSDLNLSPNVLALPFAARLAFITYVGAQSGLFSVGGTAITDYDTNPLSLFTVGVNQFGIDYDDGGNKVSLVVVPEPGTVGSLIGGFGMLLGLRRRRNTRRA